MSDRPFDRSIRDWLEAGSDRTPPSAIDAVLLAVKTTPQERGLRIPWRFTPMPTNMRVAAGIALAAVVGVAALTYVQSSPGPGVVGQTSSPSSSALASSSPSPTAIGTGSWISYTSERYGFDIKRPPNWIEIQQSDHVWTLPEAADFLSTSTEDFYNSGLADLGVRVSAWAVAVEPGTTLEAWVEAYCEAGGPPCPGVLDAAVPLTVDGHAGVSLAGPAEDSRAFVLVANRVYVVTAWRTDNDPSVAPYGGGRRLVEAFVSTMRLRPGGPVPVAAAPALTRSFTSERYGFSMEFPDAWTAAPAPALWVPGRDIDASADTFAPPGGATGFRAVSALHGSTAVDDWITAYVTNLAVAECAPVRITLVEILVDGQHGRIRTSCDEVEVTLVVGDRFYMFTLFLGDGEPYSTAGGRALLEAMMASVQLTPETAEVPPS